MSSGHPEATSDETSRLLDETADELYGLLPAEFTAARDARALRARRGGQKELAAAIKKLGRPTVAAWLANRLVRDRGAAIDQLLALGAAMRNAQRELKAGELRRMSVQRHRIVGEFAAQARILAANAGVALSAVTERELTATLEAAIADDAASEALKSARLTTAISYSGFLTLASTDDSAAGLPPTDHAAPEAPADTALAEERATAEAALATAQTTAGAQRLEADEREKAWEAARCRHHERVQDIADLEAQLTNMRHDEAEAARRVAQAFEALEAARRHAEEANERLVHQQQLVRRLSEGDDYPPSMQATQTDTGRAPSTKPTSHGRDDPPA